MRTGKFTLAFAYLRLSNEEAREGESSSIGNQRMMIQNYCKQNGIRYLALAGALPANLHFLNKFRYFRFHENL